MIHGLYISLPSKYRRQTAIGLHCLSNRIVDHPTRMCDEKYIVSEYLFWGPTPSNNWPTKNGVFFLIRGFVTSKNKTIHFFHLTTMK